MSDAGSVAVLAERLAAHPRTTVLTGAGVSVASGVPSFRGMGGLWKGKRATDMATPDAFARDPAGVWAWYDWRRQQLAMCAPNRAHEVIASWSRSLDDFTLVTQNVDGLHERADTENVVRFHGSIWEVRCWENCDASPGSWWDDTAPLEAVPPPCPYCGGLLRPGVVWFGEAIPPDALERSLAAAECELFIVAGTSAVVHPAASLVDVARDHGAFTVEVNPDETPASGSVDLVLRGPAEEVLDAVEALGDRPA